MPGCTGATRKAQSYLPTLPRDAKILDIGCGSGSQTRELANLTSACDRYFKEMEKSRSVAVCGKCLYICPYGRKPESGKRQ